MYKVFFKDVEVFHSSTIEDALAFALSLHRSSNVNHVIKVYNPKEDNCAVTLINGNNEPLDDVRS